MSKRWSAILFDLDGTLLPMDYDEFTKAYFGLLSRRFSEFDPKMLVASIWKGTKAMMANDGQITNEKMFWKVFSEIMGEDILSRIGDFDQFYTSDFHKAQAFTQPNPLAGEIIRCAREYADRVVLATNPLFPKCGVEARLSWIGLKSGDFDLITHYSNSCHCKPNPAYYQDIMDALNLNPADCLMVGNDVQEDAQAASELGISTFLIKDCIIHRDMDYSAYPSGSWKDFMAFCEA